MRPVSFVGTVVAVVVAAALSAAVSHADPLQRPARTSALAPQRLVTSVTAIGPQRLIAVGQRGHLLLSDDSGASWRQGALPLSSDLSAVQFVDTQHGYAVGHDGVVLGSSESPRFS